MKLAKNTAVVVELICGYLQGRVWSSQASTAPLLKQKSQATSELLRHWGSGQAVRLEFVLGVSLLDFELLPSGCLELTHRSHRS